jgi:3-oxoacyl-[acyl-carrier-protein] synthase II
MNLENEILSIVSAIIQVPEADIQMDASFFNEYGMDSLKALEILAEIENKYKITIDPEKLMEMTWKAMINNKVYITGLGIVSEHGNTLEEFWNSLNTKENVISKNYSFHANYDYNNFTFYEENFLNMCVEAVNSAYKDANINSYDKNGCIIIGTGMGLSDTFLYSGNLEVDFMSKLKDKLEKKLDDYMKVHIIITANACCAGAQAIAYGYSLMQAGKYDYVLAGGAEAYSIITNSGFLRINCIDTTGCKPFDKSRKGIQVGAGTAFFMLQNQNYGKIYGEILAQAVTSDAYHVVSPEPTGRFAKKAIMEVVNRAGISSDDIDAVIAHGTGTYLNDSIEACILEQVCKKADVTAPKGSIGHSGGASGAFGILAAIGMLHYQEVPPVNNLEQIDEAFNINLIKGAAKQKDIGKVLIDCFAFGGTNTVLLLGLPENYNVIVDKSVTITEEDYSRNTFQLLDDRIMDVFTKKVLYTVNQLFSGDFTTLDIDTTGAVISTRTGAYTSLNKLSESIRNSGYKGINPSLFPNVMLSTALSRLAIYCGIHGPTCAFYDREGKGKDAYDYCVNQIQSNNCKVMILICVDEVGDCRGSLISGKK